MLVAIFLTILDTRGYFNWLKRPVGKLVNPSKQAVYLNEVSDPDVGQTIKGELAILEAESLKLKLENKRLRELLETKLPPNWKFVPANVLRLSDDQMTIDVGEVMEIKKDMLVIGLEKQELNGGIVLGQVSKVDQMKSTVNLISHEESVVRMKTQSGAEGMVKGDGETMKLTEVLQEHSLTEGDLIMTKGLDGWLPNLVVGRVGKVNKLDTEIYQEAEIIKILRLDSLRQVFVVSL